MASDETRNDVWQELLDAARLARYYEALSDRHQRKHRIVRFLLFVAGASAVATVLKFLPGEAQAVVGGLVAIVVAWDFVSDYAQKAAVLRTVSIACSELESEWRELWHDVNHDVVDEPQLRDQLQRLARRTREVTSRAGDAGVSVDQKLNERCAESAYKVVSDRYAL